ncbi:hypothetical protein AST03_13370 [Staphylococcus equorum]|uniref:hypothetical protein n=1 Tax=Staphylococcus equorum TaxID=246432 RepID=UPI000852FED6|nr:hypothetical protein [Staphylococcus equorum]OEK72251.1 hypothetical protein AST03_13370 [Staphylococcus equorum]
MSQVKLGDKNIPFIYQGKELLYPNPVKDGLILYYDFKGMKNSDMTKGIAKDLSGNGNDGTLSNFAYSSGSGYDEGLIFDNVDDEVLTDVFIGNNFTLSLTLEIDLNAEVQFFAGFDDPVFYMRKFYDALHCSVYTDKQLDGTSGGNDFFNKLKINNKNKAVVTMKVDSSNKILGLYGNDEKLSSINTEKSVKEVSLKKLGRWIEGDNLAGKILSAKAYNRALSDQEIQHNYQIEKERWGL